METTPQNSYPDPTHPALAGRVIAGCRLIELLGSGGMGAVWKAHHLALDVPVAVKLLLPNKNYEMRLDERLLREARAAAKLRHPHIVGVLNVGVEEGLPFLVMEWVNGQSLQKKLEQHGRLSLPEAIRIVKQVLSALELTQQHGIVHRDIKPDNLLLDTAGNIKLVDLGLAKQIDAEVSLTQSGAVLGSPYYIAPEQAANSKTVDIRADIYSLGCTLFHLLAGAPPYGGTTYLEIILKHIQEPLADLSKLDPTLPPAVVDLVARMMAKDPAQRFQSPQEVLATIAAWEAKVSTVAAQPSEVIPSETKPKNRLPWRRGLGLLGAVVFLIIIGWGWRLLRPQNPSSPTTPVAVDAGLAVQETPSPQKAQTTEKRARRTIAPVRSVQKANPQRKQPEHSRNVVEPLDEQARQNVPTEPGPVGNRRSGTYGLSDALRRRDTERLRFLLDRGTSPNAPHGTVSPLHQAVALGEPVYVRMLLEKGANPNAVDSQGETPLLKAIHRGDREMGSALLDFGANPNARDRAGYTPLQLAGGDPFWRRKLLEKGAN